MDSRVHVVKATLYGSERIYFKDDRDLEAFRILRRSVRPNPPRTMTGKDFRALKKLGVEFKIQNAVQKRTRHGGFADGFEIKETGEDWEPPEPIDA